MIQCPSSTATYIILLLTLPDLSCERYVLKTASGDAIIIEASHIVAVENESALS